MRLIVISNSNTIEDEPLIVTRLFEAGLETFHIRKHKLSTKKMKEFINAIPVHFHNRIIIHSHHKLARKYDLKGIHLTKSHKKRRWRTWLTLKLISFKNPDLIITTSYNTIGQILTKKQDYNYGYAFLSPIFDNFNSKFQGGFTEHSLKSALQKATIQVVARGGIDIDTIENAHRIGFYGIAFYTSLWEKQDPVATFNKVVEKFQELGISIE
ncbi:MAG: thiamine phosphate synthase [Bacteroidetes bacterium]|nr:thiamine phosphate synthase [Bacteroidota bacterium]